MPTIQQWRWHVRAAVLYEANTLLKIEEVSLDPPNDDEVLVRVTATGACHSDYHFMDGTWNGAGFPLPMILGHEAAGTVEQIGARVRTTKPGDQA
jgi:S-(hydroxymethyl)glutathione dehydrogenase/alcohol dehydrogenase